jgi:hypothetical protein
MLFSDWVLGTPVHRFPSLVVSEKKADGTRKEVAGQIPVSKVICPKEQLGQEYHCRQALSVR